MKLLNKKLFLFLFTIVFSLHNYAVERYWVNGSGSWNDPNHWASFSGGPHGQSVPTLNDIVIIDNHSFTKKNQFITIDADAFCKSIKWLNTSYNPILKGNQNVSITIYEDFSIQDFFINQFFGTINITPNNKNINFYCNKNLNSIINIIGNQNSSIDLNSSLSTSKTINFFSGIINSNNYPIECSQFIIDSDNPKRLYLGSSKVTVDKWIINDNTVFIDYGNSTIIEKTKQQVKNKTKSSFIPTVTTIPVSCKDSCNGLAFVTVSGGTPPFQYTWYNALGDPIGNNDTITNLCEGTYTAVVKDYDGDIEGATGSVTSPGAIIIVSSTTVKVSCKGGADGEVRLNVVVGGTPPRNYLWSTTPAQTTNKATGLTAGTYTVTISDANGCSRSQSFVVSEPPLLVSTLSATNVLCKGSNNGTISATVNGGTTPYTYSWDDAASQTTATIVGLAPRLYHCTVTDSKGCIDIDSITITEPTQLTITTFKQDATCGNFCNGSATASGNGGTTPYSYNWNDPENQTTAIATALCHGNYLVTVTDANSCKTVGSVTITEPAILSVSINGFTNVSCYGLCNGSATASASGGTPSYTYIWNDPEPAQTSAIVTELCASTVYNVTVTDANGCTATNSVSVTQPDILSLSFNKNNVSCNGGSNGSITAIASGGTTAYTYSWNNGATGSTRTGLTAGTYTVTVKDANSCTALNSVTITQPTVLSVNISRTNVSCYGGSNGAATATGSGGVTPYIYSWNTGATGSTRSGLSAATFTVTITDANSCTASNSVTITQPTALSVNFSQTNVSCNGGSNGAATAIGSGGVTPYTYSWNTGATGSTRSGLSAATYTVTITDANSCTASNSVTITQPTALSVNFSQTNVSCNGGSNGAATAIGSGGVTPYTYSWNTGATGSTRSGLSAATYTVTITDANSCTASNSVTITQPTALTISFTNTNVLCNGGATGTATANPSGGIPSYFYSWNIGGTTQSKINLSAGTYTVTVTDANSCTKSGAVSITAPNELIVTIAGNNISCFNGTNGSATANTSGGTTPYTYQWNIGGTTDIKTNLSSGTYTCTVTDKNGCSAINSVILTHPTLLLVSISGTNISCNGGNNGTATAIGSGGITSYNYTWNTGITGSTPTGLTAGTYTVTIIDANSCTASSSITLTEPTSISTTISKTNVVCNGGNNGSASVVASGGILPYNYSWNTSATNTTINGLTAATYTVTITDANNCTVSSSVVITEPLPITVNFNVKTPLCYGNCNGEATVSVNGGNGGYTYSWSNGKGTTTTATGLCGGTTYIISVTDIFGCSDTSSVKPTNSPQIVINPDPVSHTNVTCSGGSDGTITIAATGGKPPYEYSINGGVSFQSSNYFTGLKTGFYPIVVRDSNKCFVVGTNPTFIQDGILIVPDPVMHSNVTCNRASNGTITIFATGGVSPLEYSINGGLNYYSNPVFTGLDTGVYKIKVKDKNNCITTGASVTITEPSPITISINSKVNPTCHNDCDGTIRIDVLGGTPSYIYSWNNLQTNSSATGLCAGTYTITVTDNNSCTKTFQYILTEPDSIKITINKTDISCYGRCDGSATALVTGGTVAGNYNYIWGPGITGPYSNTASNLCKKTYNVLVFDDNLCSATNNITINEPTQLSIAISNKNNATCYNTCTGSATSLVSGGTSPYYYSWSNGQTTWSAMNLCATTYSVTTTDANSCTASTSTSITQPTQIISSIIAQGPTYCGTDSSGFATVSVSGGTTPYSYHWTSGATGSTASHLWTGIHFVTITDNKSCTTYDTVTINDTSALALNIIDISHLLCASTCQGAATVNASGTTTPYTYTWSNGQTGNIASSLCASTYQVTAYDAYGCARSELVTINNNAILTASFSSVIHNTCYGDCKGKATIIASGGITPYTYKWSIPGTTATISNLCAGKYYVTVSDNNSCQYIDSITITQPSEYIASITNKYNLTCHGVCNGSATVTQTGGISPYNYSWSNGQTSAIATNLCAGTYSVTISDAISCTTTTSTTLTQPSKLTATITDSVMIACYGDTTGTAIVTTSGGSTPYSYLWTNNKTTAINTTLWAGKHIVTVMDANGCSTKDSVIILDALPITIILTKTNIKCSGKPTGSATALVSGGTSPYQYLWSNTKTTSILTGLAVGSYTVTITDSKLCSKTATINIIEDNVLTSFISDTTPINCNGNCSGSITLSTSGGVTPYSFIWSNGGTSSVAVSLCSGTYSVTTTDAALCTVVNTLTIVEPPIFTAVISEKINVICNSSCTGLLSATQTGGTSPYSYLWSNGKTNATITNLCANSYTLTITDVNACTTTINSTITQPEKLIATITNNTKANCGMADGSASVAVSGGVSPYQYSWSNGKTTALNTNLAVGVYIVTVTDLNLCTAVDTIKIDDTSNIIITTQNITQLTCSETCSGAISVIANGGISPYTYGWSTGSTANIITNLCSGNYTVTATDINHCAATLTVNLTPVSSLNVSIDSIIPRCSGNCNGSITAETTGGVSPYTYTWSTTQSGSIISGLCAGIYTVTVTDINSCSTTRIITINNPEELTVSITKQNLLCYNSCEGKATAIVSGGISPYQYSWSNGKTESIVTNLCANTYSLTITDANTCSKTINTTITQPPRLNVTISNTTTAHCGSSDGSTSATVSGGISPYQYSWSNGKTTASNNNLSVGIYIITVTDNNLCITTDTAEVKDTSNIKITTLNITPQLCSGVCNGSITVAANGGASPYAYIWSNGATTNTISNLCEGNYIITTTDANNCAATEIINLMSMPSVFITIDSTLPQCSGNCNGSITAQVTGGTSPYTYTWSTTQSSSSINNLCAGNYTVTVSDNNSCSAIRSITIINPTVLNISITKQNPLCYNSCEGRATAIINGGISPYNYLWSNGESTNSITNLCSDLYTITITDAANCQKTTSIMINEPTELRITVLDIKEAHCGEDDGSVTIMASGGTSPYNYSWSNGKTTTTNINLEVGVYFVTVTDNNLCSVTDTVQISDESNIQISTINIIPIGCGGGCSASISVNATGGYSPYKYTWSNGATTSTVSNLCAGTYFLTATDAFDCAATEYFTIKNVSSLTLVADTILPKCNNQCTGSINIHAKGGTTPYSYSWSVLGNDSVLTNLCSGTYSVTVTDKNSCSGKFSVTLPNPPAINISVNTTNAKCFNLCDGRATVNVTGGISPYTYLWSDGNTASMRTGICAGLYTITVTDKNSCTATINTVIAEPTQILSTISDTILPACGKDSSGIATVTATGGVLPYTYLWTNGQTTATATKLYAGLFKVTITDANGCIKHDSVLLTDTSNLVINISDITHLRCSGICNGSISVTALGGTPQYTYLWSDTKTTATITNVCAGTYTVTVTDANKCLRIAQATVTDAAALTATFSNIKNIMCKGNCDGSQQIIVTGGTSPYTYLWNNAKTESQISGLCAGTYIVTVSDKNGCTYSRSNNITEPSSLEVTIQNKNVLCFGLCNAQATANGIGGTSPYTYVWSNGQNNNIITNICTGNYTVTIIDANACINSTSTHITEPTKLTISIIDTNQLHCGDTTGIISINASGGTLPYSYLWSNNNTNSILSGISVGIYYITVTDNNGCSQTGYNIINDMSNINFSISEINHITCSGNCNGSIKTSISGGSTPYSYIWSNGKTDSNISELCSGIYSVTVTDSNQCARAIWGEVKQAATLLYTYTTNPISCNGLCNGAYTVTGLGGTTPYAYLWSNAATTNTLSNLCAGNYTVTITDKNSCSKIVELTLTQPSSLQTTIEVLNSVSCKGECSGTAKAKVFGGTTPYKYIWNNLNTDSIAKNLCAGNYSITLTDANLCTATATQIITEPTQKLMVTIVDSGNVACGGTDTSGYAIARAIGGNSPYKYSWSNGISDTIITKLSAGIYIVSVTDGNNCIVSTSTQITDTSNLRIQLSDTLHVICANLCTGAATVSASGGSTPYSYHWFNNATNQSVTNLCKGLYHVTVYDSKLCSRILPITIQSPDTLRTYITDSTPLLCANSCNGQLRVRAAGGIPIYTFSWSNGINGSDNNNLCAGTYSLTVTDKNNCITTFVYKLQAPLPITLIPLVTKPLCRHNTADASIYLFTSGGNAPYRYKWSNNDTTQYVNKLFGGKYYVTVTDSTLCTAVDTINTGSIITYSPKAINDTSICYGDSIRLLASGASRYRWSPSVGLSDTTIANPYASPLVNTMYILTAYDSICEEKDTVTISIYPQYFIDAGEDVYVFHKNSAQLNVTGGENDIGMRYSWTPTTGLSNGHIKNPEATPEVTTQYYVIATSSDGCRFIDSVIVGLIPRIVYASGITPNGDNVNDVWIIDNLQFYPDIEVEIFNRWGERIFYSKGYKIPWDGTYKGKPLPAGSYYYIINMNTIYENNPVITGTITILR